MTIELWSLCKESNKELTRVIEVYAQRLKHYSKFKQVAFDNSKVNKNLPKERILEKEAADEEAARRRFLDQFEKGKADSDQNLQKLQSVLVAN